MPSRELLQTTYSSKTVLFHFEELLRFESLRFLSLTSNSGSQIQLWNEPVLLPERYAQPHLLYLGYPDNRRRNDSLLWPLLHLGTLPYIHLR